MRIHANYYDNESGEVRVVYYTDEYDNDFSEYIDNVPCDVDVSGIAFGEVTDVVKNVDNLYVTGDTEYHRLYKNEEGDLEVEITDFELI